MTTHLEQGDQPAPAAATPRIETVLFDYGLVLSGPPDPAAWSRMRSITGLDEDALHSGYWEFRHDYDRAALTGREYWKAVAAHADIQLEDAQIAALFAADVDLWTVPNPEMIAWAASLQKAGIRTGILSNIGDAIAEGIQTRLPWLAGFDHCTWSHELSLAKPDPAIYILTAEALKTEPERILFVDDREDNIAAADKLGMHGVQYTSHAAFVHAMRARGFSSLLDAGSTAALSAACVTK
jgi:putative hydrolase of the HAD superfamily